MDVEIVLFPATRVAVIEHHGPPAQEHETALRLVRWRRQNGLHPDRHRSYGVHYTDPRTTPPDQHRVDFCVSIETDVAPNDDGVQTKTIPECRCARVRHIGSRRHIHVAETLYRQWLPQSGESTGDFPIFFHYVNVGPNIREEEMITDVYLPLR